MTQTSTLQDVKLFCKLGRGAFSVEKTFTARLARGGEHVSAAPAEYCHTLSDKRLGPSEPDGEQLIDGWIDARVVKRQSDGVLVSVPSGEVLLVPEDAIQPLRSSQKNVPVQS